MGDNTRKPETISSHRGSPNKDEPLNDKDLENQLTPTNSETKYSIFTKRETYLIGCFLSLTAYWSILSSTLYFPAIPTITKEFGISTEEANLTVVIYLAFQSISPMIIAGIADNFGRKPVMVALLSCYIGVCVGLSQITVYWALLVLRMCQAVSIASTISIGMGVVADLTPKLTRGGLSGFVNGIILSGQALGGLIGGALASRWGVSGIFSFCAIGAGVALICNLLFVPETNRRIVGNQSIPPPKLYHQLFLITLPRFKKRLTNDISTIIEKPSGSMILSAIRIFFTKMVFFTMLPTGLAFATWSMSMTALSTVLEADYGFSEIEIGLSYLPAGAGSIISSITGGFLLNWNYRRRKAHSDEHKVPFEIHKVRLEFTTRISIAFVAATLVFGWCLRYEVNLAPIFIAHFVLSFVVVWFLTILQTVLVDLHPAQSSAASSCLNLMRGGMSAIFVAAQDKMIKTLTIGGCFTFLAGVYTISFILFRIVIMVDKKEGPDSQSDENQSGDNQSSNNQSADN